MRKVFMKHSFSATDLYRGWNTRKFLRFKYANNKNNKVRLVCGAIFAYCIALILNDLIQNGVTFKFPQADSYLEMACISGDEFKKAYANDDGFAQVDYLASNFKTYYPQFRSVRNGKIKKRRVILDKIRQSQLINLINSGRMY